MLKQKTEYRDGDVKGSETITVIDVGTTKVCTVIGKSDSEGNVSVIGHSVVPCSGLKKGNVTDVLATTNAVKQSVDQIRKSTGYSVESACVGVTGSHVAFRNTKTKVELNGDQGPITAGDLNQDAPSEILPEPEHNLIHAIRMSYSVDGQDGIRNPTGMHSRDLEVETHIVTGGAEFIGKLVQAVEAAGVRVKSLVFEPLASALAVLDDKEKEDGAILVDIGGGTTDVVVFANGQVRYSGVIPVGGHQFTNDIAMTFNTTLEAAESAKVNYASAEVMPSSLEQEVCFPVKGRDLDLKVKQIEVIQLTRERALELARLVMLKIDELKDSGTPISHMVLTGGASSLSGLTEMMQRKLSFTVRQGMPSVNGRIPEDLRGPSYSTAMGMLVWAINEYALGAAGEFSREYVATPQFSGGMLSNLFHKLIKFGSVGLLTERR